MSNTHDELMAKLEKLAYERTIPFCYSCYKRCPSGVCPDCHTDDLMRELEGVGVEYGTDWVVKHIIREELEPVDVEQRTLDLLNECYEPVKIVCLERKAGDLLKELDPVAFSCCVADEESALLEDEDSYIEIEGDIYEVCEVEKLVDHIELDDDEE